MIFSQIIFYSLLGLGIVEVGISYSNSKLLTSNIMRNKVVENKSEYTKESRKRHKISGIINLFMGIFYYFSIGKYEAVILIIGMLAHVFNVMKFDSETRIYLKDKC